MDDPKVLAKKKLVPNKQNLLMIKKKDGRNSQRNAEAASDSDDSDDAFS